MTIYDLSVSQLKRAAVIKERIQGLNKELSAILDAPATSRAAPRKSGMSASARKKLRLLKEHDGRIFEEQSQRRGQPHLLPRPKRKR